MELPKWGMGDVEKFVKSGTDWKGKQEVVEYVGEGPLEEIVDDMTPDNTLTNVDHVPGTSTYIISEHDKAHVQKYGG